MAREGVMGVLPPPAEAGAASMSRSDDEGVSWDGRFSSAGDESSAPLASATEKTLRASSVERPKPALASARRVHGERMPALLSSAQWLDGAHAQVELDAFGRRVTLELPADVDERLG